MWRQPAIKFLSLVGVLFVSLCVWAEPKRTLVEEGFVAMEDGARLYFSKYGTGSKTVVIPNGVFLEESFTRLAGSNRTLIFYDMRNRGRSDFVQNADTLTIQQDIHDLEQLRKHFKLDRFSLIGVSYLGSMVILYTAEHPQVVERVIQIGAVPLKFGTKYDPQFDVRDPKPVIDPDKEKELKKLREEGHDKKYPRDYCERDWLVFREYFVGDPADAPKLGSVCHFPNEWPIHFRRHLEHHFGSVQKLNVPREEIKKIEQQVLTVHGTKDRNAPYGSGREWAFLLPNARLLTLQGVAHFPWVEVPELLFPAIDQFLNGKWPEKVQKVSTDPIAKN